MTTTEQAGTGTPADKAATGNKFKTVLKGMFTRGSRNSLDPRDLIERGYAQGVDKGDWIAEAKQSADNHHKATEDVEKVMAAAREAREKKRAGEEVDDPKVRDLAARADEYSIENMLGLLRSVSHKFEDVSRQCVGMEREATALHLDLEMIKDSGAAGIYGLAAEAMRTINYRIRSQGKILVELADTFSDLVDDVFDPTTEQLVRYEEFKKNAADLFDDAQRAQAHHMQACLEALRDQVLRAWVLKHPDKVSKRVKKALVVADQGINFVDFGSEVMGYVPEEHVQMASQITGAAAEGMHAGKAVADVAIKEWDQKRQVENVKTTKVLGIEYIMLDEDPLMVAERLAKKRVEEVELAVALTRPIFVVAGIFVPDVPIFGNLKPAAVHERVCQVVVTAVDRYQKKRLDEARAKLRALEDEDKLNEESTNKVWAQEFGKKALDNLVDEVKDNVFSVLNPFELLTDAIIQTLLDAVVDAIVKSLPPDPAQIVNGSTLEGAVNRILETRYGHLKIVLEPVRQKHIAATLTHDELGRPVQAILSRLQEDDLGEYVVARIEGVDQIGRLYVNEPHPFRVNPDNDRDYAAAPTTGRVPIPGVPVGQPISFDEVLLDQSRQGDEGVQECKARYREVWGFVRLDARHLFTPTEPDGGSIGVWRDRFIAPDGWYPKDQRGKAAALVAGSWYRPWQDKGHYLFAPASGDGYEWAEALDKAGNTPTAKVYDVMTEAMNVTPGFPKDYWTR